MASLVETAKTWDPRYYEGTRHIINPPAKLEGADLVEYLWGKEAREQYEKGLGK